MNSKVLIGGFLAAVTYFILGFLIYGVLLKDTMATYFSCQRPMEEMNWTFLIIANLFGGWFLAYVFSRANIMTAAAGATMGAIMGLLLSISFDSSIYATSTMINNMTGIMIDVVLSIVMWGIAGSVVGWWMGRK
jgi:hypothetical protein